LVQVSPSTPENPALHSHVVPDADTTEFKGHDTQRPGLAPSLYIPAPHCMHVSPFTPTRRELHKHAVLSKLALGDVECNGQFEHVPASFLNLSAAHGVQTSPFTPVYPALHEQAALVVLPAFDIAFSGQFTHVPGPNPGLYVFEAH